LQKHENKYYEKRSDYIVSLTKRNHLSGYNDFTKNNKAFQTIVKATGEEDR